MNRHEHNDNNGYCKNRSTSNNNDNNNDVVIIVVVVIVVVVIVVVVGGGGGFCFSVSAGVAGTPQPSIRVRHNFRKGVERPQSAAA